VASPALSGHGEAEDRAVVVAGDKAAPVAMRLGLTAPSLLRDRRRRCCPRTASRQHKVESFAGVDPPSPMLDLMDGESDQRTVQHLRKRQEGYECASTDAIAHGLEAMRRL